MWALKNISNFYHISSSTEVNSALSASLIAILSTWCYLFYFD